MINPEYNILKVAGRTSGYKHTEKWKKDNAKRMLGNKHAAGKKRVQSNEIDEISNEDILKLKEAIC